MQNNLDLLWAMKSINSELIRPFQVSFGPNGLGIVLADEFSTSITRRGLDILEFLELRHPLCGWLLKSAQNLGREVGDGVKTFVLFLDKFVDQLKEENRREFLFQLKRLIACLDDHTARLAFSETDRTFDYVTGFFSTRFPHGANETLARLTSEWITTSGLSADCLLSHFDCLVNVNTENCNALEGDLEIPGRYVGRIVSYWTPVVLVVVHNSDHWPGVSGLLEGTNYLVLTNSEVSSKNSFELRKRGINFVHMVPEYFSFFLHEMQCLKYSEGISELIAQFTTGSSLINPTLRLRLSGVNRLNVSAPSQRLVKNFNENIKDCLTMLRFSRGSPAIASGQFYRQMAAILLGTNVVEACRKELNQTEIIAHSSLSELEPLVRDLNLNSDFISVVARTLLSIDGQTSSVGESLHVCEPLRVRLVVLSRSLSCLYQFLRVDCILPRKISIKNEEDDDRE